MAQVRRCRREGFTAMQIRAKLIQQGYSKQYTYTICPLPLAQRRRVQQASGGMSTGNTKRGISKRRAGSLGGSVRTNTLSKYELTIPTSAEVHQNIAALAKSRGLDVKEIERTIKKHCRNEHGTSPKTCMPISLIEAWADPSSTWSVQNAAVGGASLRLVKPRNRQDNYLPGRCPELIKGRVVQWEIDLHTPAGSKAYLRYLRAFRLAPGTLRAHHHTSPMCTSTNSLRVVNESKGVSRSVYAKWKTYDKALSLARKAHRVFRRNRHIPRSSTQSHELARGSTSRLTRGFPWAITRKTRRLSVSGCVVGLWGRHPKIRGRQAPCCKAWTFESDNHKLLKHLSHFVCPQRHVRSYVCSGGGKYYMGAEASAHYPSPLGLLLTLGSTDARPLRLCLRSANRLPHD